jgi:IclR family KDG regulon transcriptional repressor
MDKDNKYQVPIIINSGKILEYLRSYHTSHRTLTEISQDLGINKSSCYRILRTLQDMKYVNYDESSKRFSLGPYLIVLGSRAFEQIDYLSIGKKYLKKVSLETGFNSAIIQKISDDRLTFVDKEEVERSMQVSISIGSQFPITRVSGGKCYLAYCSNEELENQLSKGIKKVTKNSIIDIEEYKQELYKVRANGYATAIEESIEGINSASAPVFNSKGEVLMVICIVGITAQFHGEKLKECGEIVKRYAFDLTKELNGKIPSEKELFM